jgi:phosphopantothenoylcysteine synthetase/decarboxylase
MSWSEFHTFVASSVSEPAEPDPRLPFGRLLVLGCGSLSVAFLPFWMNWLALNHPTLEVRCVLTSSAARLVSPRALAALTRAPVPLDVYEDLGGDPAVEHLDITTWADAIAVAPASLDTLVRISEGRADTPVTLAIATNRLPVCVAPSVPPNAELAPVVQEALARLQRRPRTVVARFARVRSAHSGDVSPGGMAPFGAILEALSGIVEADRAEPDAPDASGRGGAS